MIDSLLQLSNVDFEGVPGCGCVFACTQRSMDESAVAGKPFSTLQVNLGFALNYRSSSAL
jgi:hypothetical protein